MMAAWFRRPEPALSEIRGSGRGRCAPAPGEPIVRKAREEPRDRDRAFEPRHRHADALVRPGAEAEMPVRLRPTSKRRDRRTRRDRGWRRRCRASPACPAGSATPPSSTGVDRSCGCRAGSNFRSAAFPRPRLDSAGSAISRARSCGHSTAATSALPIRLVVVSWPALRMKMQLCSSSLRRQPLAVGLALDQPRQHVFLGVARRRAPPRDKDLEIVEEIRHRVIAARSSSVSTGSSAPRIASDQSRSGSRSSCGTASRLPITSTGIAAAKSSIRSTSRLAARPSSSRSTSAVEIGLQRRDRARIERAHDNLPHPGVQRRIVEDEARGVVLVERASPYFGANSCFLSDEKVLVVLVDRLEIGIAGQETASRSAAA